GGPGSVQRQGERVVVQRPQQQGVPEQQADQPADQQRDEPDRAGGGQDPLALPQILDPRGDLTEGAPDEPGQGRAEHRAGGAGDQQGLDCAGGGCQQQDDPRREPQPPDHAHPVRPPPRSGPVWSPVDGSAAEPSPSAAAAVPAPDLTWLSSSSSRAPRIRRNVRWTRARARTATSSWLALIPPSPLPWLDRAAIAALSAASIDMPVA